MKITRKLVNVNIVWFMNVESIGGICKAKEMVGASIPAEKSSLYLMGKNKLSR